MCRVEFLLDAQLVVGAAMLAWSMLAEDEFVAVAEHVARLQALTRVVIMFVAHSMYSEALFVVMLADFRTFSAYDVVRYAVTSFKQFLRHALDLAVPLRVHLEKFQLPLAVHVAHPLGHWQRLQIIVCRYNRRNYKDIEDVGVLEPALLAVLLGELKGILVG